MQGRVSSTFCRSVQSLLYKNPYFFFGSSQNSETGLCLGEPFQPKLESNNQDDIDLPNIVGDYIYNSGSSE